MESSDVLLRITSFIESIGLKVYAKELEVSTFLPGILIEAGDIFFDRKKLTSPGDLLHEAGHLALTKPTKRDGLTGDLTPENPAEDLEIGVILWSYAAALHLKINPAIVFHQQGYKGDAEWLLSQFANGNYIGLPLLQWMGMCRNEDEMSIDTPGFPTMLKWLRE